MKGEATLARGEATWNKFLAEWPPERVRRMTLDEYTNLNKNSFVYAIEAATSDDLGSIWGGSAYKFGVFARRNTEKPAGEKAGQALDATHGWLTKYGKTHDEAFAAVRDRLVAIVDAAQAGNTTAIDAIEFAEATKWKIAFLYQERSNAAVLPIYQSAMLRRLYKRENPEGRNDAPFSLMYKTLLAAHRSQGSALAIGQKLWVEAKVEHEEADARDGEDRERSAPHARSDQAQAGGSTPQNMILFGPPGTGKTYKTAELAVEICDGRAPNERSPLMRRYHELRAEGRIAFVTFHQSYGYEEFVEGIRPVLKSDDEGEGVRYECRDGIFKQLCKTASRRPATRGGFTIAPDDGVRVWKMSLGNTLDPDESAIYDEAVAGGYLSLGYGQGQSFLDCNTKEEVLARLREKDPSTDAQDFNVASVHTFKNKMQPGDAVIVSDGNHRFRAIGKIGAGYLPPSEGETDQRRPVEWVATFDPSLPAEQILHKAFSQQTIYELKPKVLKLSALNALLKSDGGQPKNHVIIIDEINRGNVSKILGELITLLEPDKRLGARNALAVTLPHSGEDFGVPSNVYVVGTMNTADRSIAFLDTALRRRFEFMELTPDLDVVREQVGTVGVVAGVDVAELLRVMNDRIELLYDRDHTLGHAFFVDVKSLSDLRGVFLTKVIPLLQEYFYGDWSKLCQVLGCPFDSDTGKPHPGNTKPLIEVTRLDARALSAESDDLDVRVRCTVSPKFLHADEDALAPFFTSVLATASKRATAAGRDAEEEEQHEEDAAGGVEP